MMTDERQGKALWQALEKLPRGSGVVFRHYGLPARARRELFGRVSAVARRRSLLLLVAGSDKLGHSWMSSGRHGRQLHGPPKRETRGAPAHDVTEIRAAERGGADILFLSPVYSTRSHPGSKPLGRLRFAGLARQTKLPVIALGGMNRRRARALPGFVYGWAAIDAWT
jgi:thiamine-phosphate pyrophosphorylase